MSQLPNANGIDTSMLLSVVDSDGPREAYKKNGMYGSSIFHDVDRQETTYQRLCLPKVETSRIRSRVPLQWSPKESGLLFCRLGAGMFRSIPEASRRYIL